MADQSAIPLGAAIKPPLGYLIEPSDLHERSLQLIDDNTAKQLSERILASGYRWAWVEGFSGAGKSTLAAKAAHFLNWRHIELDGLVRDDAVTSRHYPDFIDSARLDVFCALPESRSNVVIDGICLRDCLARYRPLEPAFKVYVARVSHPTSEAYLWHDGLGIECPAEGMHWMKLSTIEYHIRELPYADADMVLLRVDGSA